MIVEIVNKVLMMIFVFSMLNIFRHSLYFIQSWVSATTDNPRKYIITDKSLVVLGISISYVITALITGFGV